MRMLLGFAALAVLMPIAQHPEKAAAPPPDAEKLERAFLEHQIRLDLARGLCRIPVTIDVREDLLEYLLVNPKGAAHESLFTTEVVPSRLNAALLALGVVPGTNAKWKQKDPPPTPEEAKNGVPGFVVEVPSGDGFYLYAAWREAGETQFWRVEDLVRNLDSGRSMKRHRWIYLGSRMVHLRGPEARQAFAADIDGNLLNIAFFEEGNTLATAALPECLKQTIWLPNGWLLPERGSQVDLIFTREPLTTLPPGMEATLPEVPERSK